MNKVNGVCGLMCALVLAGCASQDILPPPEAVQVPAPREAVDRYEQVELSVFLVRGGYNTEMSDGTCDVSAGGKTVKVTAPVYLSVPVVKDKPRFLRVQCSLEIGPTVRDGAWTVLPGDKRFKIPEGRIYPERLSAPING